MEGSPNHPVVVARRLCLRQCDMLHLLDRRKAWLPVLKPWPLRSAVDGGVTIDELHPRPCCRHPDLPRRVTRTITAKNNAVFGTVCRGCPLAEQCTASTLGRARRAAR